MIKKQNKTKNKTKIIVIVDIFALNADVATTFMGCYAKRKKAFE